MFSTCPKYIENLLAIELMSLGANSIKETIGGVYAAGDLAFAYRTCLWSRLANRVLLILASQQIEDAQDLYDLVGTVDWQLHLSDQSTFWIEFQGENPEIRNTMFGAQKVKDAIVDQMRLHHDNRPTINKEEPDVNINVYLDKSSKVTLSLDLSGVSLHKRGYRKEAGAAPLKENLAAALLLRANWPLLASHNTPLIDPLCGSATLIIEALLMAADIAPGLLRHYFGFLGWLQHDLVLWESLVDEAILRRTAGLAKPLPAFFGYDGDSHVIEKAMHNLMVLDLSHCVNLSVCELANWHKPDTLSVPGLIIANPPYGERLSDLAALPFLYRHLGERIKEEFGGWQLALLTGNPDLARHLNLWAHKKYHFYNGPIACEFYLYDIRDISRTDKPHYALSEKKNPANLPITPGVEMLLNRFKKNKKKLASWLIRENISCYRLYDADLLEYAAAIDSYQQHVLVQEYKAPKTIAPEKAAARFQEILVATAIFFQIDPARIIVKQRSKQKGANQYQKMDKLGRFYEVNEYGSQFLLNLTDYLDTGLFLDYRPVRRLIREWTPHKKFLNLFCYTATASVHAARVGASSSISVDLSPTYTRWAKQNLALNGFSDKQHVVIESDCLQWLEENQQKFDLILLDPPTFSNSKRTDTVLDIQNDHVKLIQLAMRSLKTQGKVIFSTNFRQFKLDSDHLLEFIIEDITPKTFDPDFLRDKKLHHCWIITHKNAS